MKKALVIFFISTFTFVMAQENESTARYFALRLKPHQDLKEQLIAFGKQHRLKAACIVTCVGSLEQFHLRYANQSEGVKANGHFEIVSLTGTFSDTSSHLHLTVADSSGRTIGGHLLDHNFVYTTAEVISAELSDLELIREKDSTYGYQELAIKKRSNKKSHE